MSFSDESGFEMPGHSDEAGSLYCGLTWCSGRGFNRDSPSYVKFYCILDLMLFFFLTLICLTSLLLAFPFQYIAIDFYYICYKDSSTSGIILQYHNVYSL